jgi:hypothetical protein
LNRSKFRNEIHNHSLIFVTEDDPWQWAIALEHSISLKKQRENVLIIYIAHNYVEEAKNLAKRLLGWKGSRQNVRQSLVELGIVYLVVQAFTPSFKSHMFSLSELKELLYPGIVASTGKRNVASFKDAWIWILNFQKAFRILKAIHKYEISSNLPLCFVPNGKIVSAAVTVNSLRRMNCKVKILESGSKPDRLQIWDESAQSQSEADSLMALMWGSAPIEIRERRAKNYFEERRNTKILDPYHLVSWASLTTKGLLPAIECGKKVATFYSSSQIEQIGADSLLPEYFQDQGSALACVLNSLDPEKWIVFLRKHPVPTLAKSNFDDEDDIWSKTKSFAHLRIIDSNSRIDSFELAAKSDVVFHYNSSIGAEIIYHKLAPVITMGNTSWSSLHAGYSALNCSELRDLLNGKELQIESPEKILPWAFFHAEFGEPFSKVVLAEGNTWKIEGVNLHPTFKSYLRNRLQGKITS